MKKQGYNDKLDDSLGGKTRKKMKQSMKSRRKESEGMEKAEGKRKYSSVKTMDKKKAVKSPAKVGKVMKKYKEGKLHSGIKKCPKVKSKKQAIAIALSEDRKGKK